MSRVEQDHRAIKRSCASMTGFKSFHSVAITLSGIELAHRLRTRQFSFGPGRQRRAWSLKQLWDRARAYFHIWGRGWIRSTRTPPMHQNSFGAPPGISSALARFAL